MNIIDLIRDDQCAVLRSGSKTEAILELVDLAEKSGGISDVESLKKEIFYREQIMSTGLGMSLAVPHVRFSGIKSPKVLVGLKPSGIGDYESLDNEPVRIVVMILVGEDQHKEYLRILSLIVHKLKDRSFQERLLSSEESAAIAAVLKGE